MCQQTIKADNQTIATIRSIFFTDFFGSATDEFINLWLRSSMRLTRHKQKKPQETNKAMKRSLLNVCKLSNYEMIIPTVYVLCIAHYYCVMNVIEVSNERG